MRFVYNVFTNKNIFASVSTFAICSGHPKRRALAQHSRLDHVIIHADPVETAFLGVIGEGLPDVLPSDAGGRGGLCDGGVEAHGGCLYGGCD